MNEIEISTDPTRLDLDYIHAFLRTTYWAEGIPRSMVEKSILNSLSFGLYKDKKQIGFGRVITDYTTFGYLADVFVDETERGKGYGNRLISAMVKHELLQDLKRWHLVTTDAHALYRNFDFSSPAEPERHMERRIIPSYRQNLS